MLTRTCINCNRKNTAVKMLNPNENYYVNMKCKYKNNGTYGSLGVPTATDPYKDKVPGSSIIPPFNGLVSTANLISYWKLNETSGQRNDSFGTNHLTDNSSVGSAVGKLGNCGSFVASVPQFLSRVSNPSLQTGNIDFTIYAWFNRTRLTDECLVSKDSNVGREYNLDLRPTLGRLSVGAVGSFAGTAGAPFTFSTGVWYLIIGWLDTLNNTVNVQVNNGIVASTVLIFPPAASDVDFRIGSGSYPTFEFPFDGLIDEVGFFKRVLSSVERTALFNNGNGLSL